MVNDDELRRLLDRTRDHNVTASRLTDAEFAALPNRHKLALQAILADDDHPDRSTLRGYFAQVRNDRAANLLDGLVAQNRIDLSNPAMAGVVAADRDTPTSRAAARTLHPRARNSMNR
ncbi:hypothetical protein [Mycobacterium simiae]|uniref:hypothetical protein n=1 Tax=Mycobacterium simiae TaxID=1784 RepID=UPI001593277D|nr:hypothetical protein [Mycobacterium simiae]